MAYEKCRDCKYRCTCYSSRADGMKCSGCENYYDEYQPAKNIKYCLLSGKKVDLEKD